MVSRPSQVRYLVAVVQEGQITRAAQKLGVAQPVLSQAIAQLEAELGIDLLERHPRGVTPTLAGEAFLAKARVALAAEEQAVETARAFARRTRNELVVGFVGPPPTASFPELFASFSSRCPEAKLTLRDLPFPQAEVASWLAGVDLVVCHPPELPEDAEVQTVRVEPRAIVLPADHPLAGRQEIPVEEVLDETFVSYHPSVDPRWSAFHTLDDVRAAPPKATTADQAVNSLQMAGILSCASAVTAIPYTDARLARLLLTNIAVVPLAGAPPARLSLVWRRESENPLLAALVAAARALESDGA